MQGEQLPERDRHRRDHADGEPVSVLHQPLQVGAVEKGKNPHKFIAAPDRLKDGFDAQVRQMQRLGEEIMRRLAD